MLLYKYAGPSGIAILKNRSIWLTDPRSFNDPFDVNPHFDNGVFISTSGHMNRRLLEVVRVTTKSHQLRTAHTVILSLAENRNSQLMWAHYAAAHKGLAIGFDSTRGILADPGGDTRTCARVVYQEHRPTAPHCDELTNEQVLFTKSRQWAYEAEWRIKDTLYSADADYAVNRFGERSDGDPHWTFAIRTDAVREVIVGCRAETALLTELESVLAEPDYHHVRLLQAVPDARTYDLRFEPIEK